MQEIELKFQIPEGALAAVTADVDARPGASDERLQAHYFDTPDRRLGQARSALRLRKEGERWVQTLKAMGANTMMRVEDNQAAPAPAQGGPARIDLGLHRGTPAQDALVRSLGWDAGRDPTGAQTGLVELYRTDIWRRTARTAVGQDTAHAGVVELALDLGHIHGGHLSVPVRELEIELVEGPPMAVLDSARDWVSRHGLWLDTQTKAQRGDRLARQSAGEAPQAMLALAPPADLATGLEAVTTHMSSVASDTDDTVRAAQSWREALNHLMSLPAAGPAWPDVAQLLRALDLAKAPADVARAPSSTLLCLDLFALLLAG